MSQRTIYLAGGCFWGLEELFREEPGVINTEVGYAGGDNDNPDYYNHPGHAEALAITYDTDKTTYAAILDFFFRIHDPTTVNRQGNDVGSSYRSAIFYQNDEELTTAKEVIDMVNRSGLYRKSVVTTLEKFTKFYTAEDYHQDYLRKNPGGYTCHYVRTEESLIGSN
jgi:peptide-methionine (S)-S-oxide reductase